MVEPVEGVLGLQQVDGAGLGADGLEQLHERGHRRWALDRVDGLSDLLQQGVGARDDGLGEDVLERGVVGVEGASGEPRLLDDVVDAGAGDALGDDHVRRRLDEARAGVRPLAQAALGCG